MRGKTVKKLSKFANMLIANTNPDDQNAKDKPTLMRELKQHWNTNGVKGQQFIREALKAEYGKW